MLLRNLDNRDAPDYAGFVNDLSEITQRQIPEIVEKSSLTTFIRRNQALILGVIGAAIPLLVALYPYIIPYAVNPIIESWSQLFHPPP